VIARIRIRACKYERYALEEEKKREDETEGERQREREREREGGREREKGEREREKERETDRQNAVDEHGRRGKSLNGIPSGPSNATQR